jgi:hypothetical protein
MKYADLIEKRYQLQIELAAIEREILKFNNATLFVQPKPRKKAGVNGAKGITPDWEPTEHDLLKAREEHPTLMLGTETEKFKNYHLAKGTKMKDYTSAWRNWLHNAERWQ